MGTININGGRDGKRRAVLREYIENKDMDIIFLQETHSDSANELEWKKWWGGHIFFKSWL